MIKKKLSYEIFDDLNPTYFGSIKESENIETLKKSTPNDKIT